MKHLANCAPDEFMIQSVRLREPLSEWLRGVDAEGVRARSAARFDAQETPEGRALENRAYLGELIRAGMEKAPEQTRACLCLATFTDPEAFNDHSVAEYIAAAFEMYASKELRAFFTLLIAPMFRT